MLEGIPIKVIAWAIGLLLLMAGVWRFAIYHEDVGYQRAVNAYETRLAEAARRNHERERDLQQQADLAQQERAKREKHHQVIVAVLESRVRGLRNDIASFKSRLPAATDAACAESAASVADLFGTCADEYRSLAEIADRHADDVRTLTEAWPK